MGVFVPKHSQGRVVVLSPETAEQLRVIAASMGLSLTELTQKLLGDAVAPAYRTITLSPVHSDRQEQRRRREKDTKGRNDEDR